MKHTFFHTFVCRQCGKKSDVTSEKCLHCGSPRPDLAAKGERKSKMKQEF